jgi:TolB protein
MIRVKLIGLTRGEDIIDESVKKQSSYIDTAHDISDLIYRKLTNEPSIFRSKIAMICSTDDDKNKNLFVMDYDGRRLKQLRSYKSISISPSWSPDGKYIAYTRYIKKYYRGKGNIVNQAIYLYNVSTQKETILTDSIGQNSGVTWSPDSRSIAFTMSKQADPDIYIMEVSSKSIKPLIKNFGLDVEPSFSPDGKFLVFSSSRSGRPELYKMELETQIQTRLTFSKHYNSSPSWSPMGDMIAFSGLDNPFGKGSGSKFDIFLVNPYGTKIERLTIDSGNNENPSWAPNGRHLVYSSTRNKGSDIYMINADGTGEIRLTNGPRCYSPFLVAACS